MQRSYHYYHCFGPDAYRFEGTRKCSCKPIRQDYLDDVVWEQQVVQLENPSLIQREIEKRVEKAKKTSPLLVQKAAILKQRAKQGQSINKMSY
ncbi:zinc ribbon domain-containing protein [Chitinophaga sp. LS1]|nr:zinc ribbon domain-containing protein [[Flexibacter] sp. ATCC 35208]WPV70662.1 zinc ribbon domain-containing protein [Chitinophaga sp. LS1]